MKENNSNDCLDLQELEKGLKNSPLYNLSMANKELFHSNFLAWLGTSYPCVFIDVFSKLLKIKWPDDLREFSIEREYKHYDISVIKKNDSNRIPRILIENKVKSVPTKKQLDDYRTDEENDNTGCQFVLLTVTKNLHDNEKVEGWKIITYKELSYQLSKVKLSDLSDTYHFGLLKDYCSYIKPLQCIIEHFDSEKSYYSPNEKIKEELGLHDVCGKRKAQMIYQKLVQGFAGKWTVVTDVKNPKDKEIKVAWNYTNKPVVEVRLKAGILDEYIIVQIQGNQYRHAVEYFDDTIGSRIKRIKKMTKGKEEDDFIPSQQGLDYLTHNYSYLFDFAEASTPQNYPFTAKKGFGQNRVPGYCKYCNGRIGKNGKISCFVYQWVEIPHDMTCNKLVYSVIKDINKIKAIIKRRNP